MKILMASDMFRHQVNGVSNSVLTLTTELRALGHEVKVLALSNTNHSYRDGDDYFIASHDSLIYPDARMSIKVHDPMIAELIAWRPHIAHIQTEFSVNVLAMRVVKACRIPIVMNFHTDYELFLKRYFFSKTVLSFSMTWFYRYVYRHARRLIIPSSKVQDLLDHYGVKKPTVIIPTGLTLSDFRITPLEKNELLKKYGIKNNGKVLAVISRMSREKNVEELIRYFPAVRKKLPDAGLLVVGGGPYLPKLKSVAASLGLKENVAFTDMIPPEGVNHYYQLGDVFICASTFETQGMTYVEAMANGLPLVCRYDRCLDGVIIPGENGYTYNDRDEFVKYIEEILGDEAEKRRMSEASLAQSKEYSRERFALRVEQVYIDVIREAIAEHVIR